MEAAKLLQSFQPSACIDTRKMMKRPCGLTWASQRTKEKHGIQMFISHRGTSVRQNPFAVDVSSSLNNPGSVMQSGGFPTSLDQSLVLKNKSQEIEPYLNGCCIYLVGMMGSGKTTIGKILSEVLGYSFSDSDELVEQKLGGMPVSEIFKQHGEGFFRNKETEVLQELSMMHQLVVSTGGGAVIRSINWKHMRKGVSVWIDVPVDCLAQRVSAVGTDSRPLLCGESGDTYSKALTKLSRLLQERGEAYANASTRVCLENIAAKLGHVDVDNLTPTIIAIEVLDQIVNFLKAHKFAV